MGKALIGLQMLTGGARHHDWCKLVPNRRRRRTAPWPLVSGINPQLCRFDSVLSAIFALLLQLDAFTDP